VASLALARIDAALRDKVLALRVHPAQLDYVGHIGDLLADAEHSRDCEPTAVLRDGAPIGFYRIDLHPRSVAGRDFDVPALGLRGFFLDAQWQGRGLARPVLAALLADLAARHPWARLLVLTVNHSNHAARRLYRHAGFVDGSEQYHGGRAGPQQLMLRSLP
jgi:RimJ/RimL family protein N-acetyltransferase